MDGVNNGEGMKEGRKELLVANYPLPRPTAPIVRVLSIFVVSMWKKKQFAIPSEIPPTLISESAFSFDLISPTQFRIQDLTT
jgi:hypothetical protein